MVLGMDITLPTCDEIKAACAARKISVNALCKRAGVGPALFYRAVAGQNMSMRTMGRLVNTLNAIPIPPPPPEPEKEP